LPLGLAAMRSSTAHSIFQVSDYYVKLGNDFNVAVSAFTALEIPMQCVPPGYATTAAAANLLDRSAKGPPLGSCCPARLPRTMH
jgi:hypothetical protein